MRPPPIGDGDQVFDRLEWIDCGAACQAARRVLDGPADGDQSNWQAARRIQPDYADAHYNLGIALAQQPGQRAAALAERESAMRIDNDPQTRQALDWLRSQKK